MDDEPITTINDTQPAPAAAPPARARSKASAAPATPELVAVITEPFGELKRLSRADADKLIADKAGRLATAQDIAIAG